MKITRLAQQLTCTITGIINVAESIYHNRLETMACAGEAICACMLLFMVPTTNVVVATPVMRMLLVAPLSVSTVFFHSRPWTRRASSAHRRTNLASARGLGRTRGFVGLPGAPRV